MKVGGHRQESKASIGGHSHRQESGAGAAGGGQGWEDAPWRRHGRWAQPAGRCAIVQAWQMGMAKGRKMHYGTNVAGMAKGGKVGHVAGMAGGHSQG